MGAKMLARCQRRWQQRRSNWEMRRFAAMMKRMQKCIQRNREAEQHNVHKRGRSPVKPEPTDPDFLDRAAKRIKLEASDTSIRPAMIEPSKDLAYHPSTSNRRAYGGAQPQPITSTKRRRRKQRSKSQPVLSQREQDAVKTLAFLSKRTGSKSREPSPKTLISPDTKVKIKPEPTDSAMIAIKPRTSWVLNDLATPLPE